MISNGASAGGRGCVCFNNNVQFSYSILSSNELKVLYILLPLAHLYTPPPSDLLNGALQGGTGDPCTIASLYCQVLIYG